MRPTVQRAAFLALLAAILVVGWRARQRWSAEVIDRGIAGDALAYYQIADHIERDGMISFDGKTPEWGRLPGYPLFLRATLHPASHVWGPNPVENMATGIAEIRFWNFLVDLACAAAAALTALALRARRFALLPPLLWALHPGSALVAMHPLADPLVTLACALSLAALARYLDVKTPIWLLLAAAFAACAQWIKLDSLALLPPLAAAPLLVETGWRRRLARAALALGVWAALFAPWPIRNLIVFGEPHVLHAGIDNQARPYDRSAEFRWMRTFDLDEEAQRTISWAIPGQPLSLAHLPASATDSPAERAEIASIFNTYNARGHQLGPDLKARLVAVARDRERRHPFDCFVRLPLTRALRLLTGKRDGYGMGTVQLLADHPGVFRLVHHLVLWTALASLAALVWARRRAQAAVLAVALFARVGMLVLLPGPEPRYLLPILPLLLALAASLPATLSAGRGSTAAARPATG